LPHAGRQPQLVIFDSGTNTGCGSATTAVGPFCCPPDQTFYVDTAFYDELRSRFGATGGPLAQLYVIAHEWGVTTTRTSPGS
jgi:predicted metalloprotease